MDSINKSVVPKTRVLISSPYFIFTLPVSILIDRWSRIKTIGMMAVLWSAAILACAFTKNLGQLFAARTAIGLGEAGYAPGGTAMISSLFPKEKRAKILGIWNASIPLGSALGIALGGIIADHFGWRHAFGLEKAMIYIPFFAMLACILFFIGSFFYNADARPFEKLEALKSDN